MLLNPVLVAESITLPSTRKVVETEFLVLETPSAAVISTVYVPSLSNVFPVTTFPSGSFTV